MLRLSNVAIYSDEMETIQQSHTPNTLFSYLKKTNLRKESVRFWPVKILPGLTAISQEDLACECKSHFEHFILKKRRIKTCWTIKNIFVPKSYIKQTTSEKCSSKNASLHVREKMKKMSLKKK